MFTWKRLLYASALSVMLFFGFVSLILPGIVIDRAKSWVANETGRTLQIGSVSINPIGLTVTVRDLSLTETDRDTPFIAWQTLSVSLSLRSLFHRAPIVDRLQLDAPYLHIERLEDNRFNFSNLIPEPDKKATPEQAGDPARFSINNLTINNGNIELIDRSLGEEIRHSIRDLNLALPAIGNLPYMVGNPVQPMLHAIVNDTPIDITGRLRPFTATREMRFNLSLDDIDLPFYLGYVPVELPFQLRNGRLSFDLELLYRVAAETGPELELGGHFDLTSLDIWDRQNQQLFFLPLLQADIAPTRPLAGDIHLGLLRVYNLEVHLNRDREGTWNHSRLKMADEGPPQKEPSDKRTTQPLKLRVDDLEIRNGVVHFRDDVPTGGFETTASEINVDLEKFALDTTEPIPVSLSLETEHDEGVKVKGDFLLNPFTLALQAELSNLLIAAYAPYYQEAYAGPLGGTMSVSARLEVNPDQPLLVSQGGMQWRKAYIAFNDKEGMGIELIDVAGLSFNLAENRLEIESARYENGRVNFSRSKEGHWSLLSRNFPVLAKLTEAPGESPSPPVKHDGPDFRYRIGELALVDWEFDIHDRLPASPVQLQARDFDLTFRNLAAPVKAWSPFEFSTAFGRRGRIQLKGEASLAEQSIRMNGRLSNIPLTTLAPYVAEQANLVLKNGTLNAKLQASAAPGAEAMQVRFGGDVGISHLHLLDGTHREDLLKWDSLQIAGIRGEAVPPKVTIDSITLSDYFAKILIDEKTRLNLSEAFRKESPAEEDAASKEFEPPKGGETDAPAEALPEIRIETVILQGGKIDFTDRHLPKAFHADMQELGGRITGLSSAPDARAEVDLRGSLRRQSPLVISGVVNPLAEKLFLDLKLNFRDIEMSPMSPYTGTYVGYLIEKGKLNLALKYHVENDRLQATNEVFLDQFTFGEPVESDKAIGLPAKLAVALLKDRNGEIHLDIPVVGNLDDPHFSIGGVIWTVIKNLLVKAATSPMALLGALVGGVGDEDFGSVNFAYGSTRLAPPEKEKLLRIAEALHDRPSLLVEIKGYVDPENDPEGFRREQLRLKVQRAKYDDLADEGALPDDLKIETVEIGDEEYPDYLWEVYKNAGFPKPRNFIGMTKRLPVEEQEKLIYTNTDVGPEQLAKLAQARAQTVLNFMVEEGQLPRERVFLATVDIEAPPERDDATRSRVEFGISVE